MEKIKINFIVTCFDKEVYWPKLKELLYSYQNIEPIVALAYNGEDPNFECSVRVENKGLQQGEFELIQAGYKYLLEQDTPSDIFVKISIDSWLCNEDVIINIFNKMQHFRVPYAGNYWSLQDELSTDIMFVNIAIVVA